MANKCVTVLAPNGRRQNVKVTPNTTVLQVLEEVCLKQGFKPEDYDITHHNKIVDATAPLRFTGLPNNAQLEMAIAKRARFESNVKVGLTLENGERLMGEFEPTETLWGIVTTLCPQEVNDGVPAVVYMGREINGETSLQETTLRSLGLTRGGAVLRFFKRSPGHVHQQANVSAPLRRPPHVERDISPHQKKKHVSVLQPAQTVHMTLTPPQQADKSETHSEKTLEPPGQLEKTDSSKTNRDETTDAVKNETEDVKSESLTDMDYDDSSSISSTVDSVELKAPPTTVSLRNQNKDEDEENIVFLGERNAVVFNLSAVPGPVEDVPDDFFDLTLDDARQLLRDHKRHQAELEEAPLLTLQQRELRKSQLLLTQLNQYRRCVVRVKFPDRLVLQGIFSPLDSFKTVMDFVRKYLQYPEAEFYLFVTPPKTILPPEQTLVGAGCVPCTLIHFGFTSGPSDKYLRDDIAEQITSPRGANIAARKSRGLTIARPSSAPVVSSAGSGVSQNNPSPSGPSNVSSTNILRAQNSSDSRAISSRGSSVVKRSPTDKVPKWFQTGK